MSKLLIVHSLYEDKLRKALDLGGFPLPSLAVIKPDNAFTRFGNITFIVNENSVNPKNKENLFFDRDIFSQRFPEPEYKVVKKNFQKLYDNANKFIKNTNKEYDAFFSLYDIDSLKHKPMDYVHSRITNDYTHKLMFLHEKNVEVDLQYKKSSFSSDLSNYEPLISYIKSQKPQHNFHDDTNFISLLNESLNSRYEYYKAITGDSVAHDIQQSYKESIFDNTGNIKGHSNELSNIFKDSKNPDIGKNIIDVEKSKNHITNQMENYLPEYNDWINKVLSDIYVEPHLKVGGKKLEFNLENIEKYMLKQKVKSVEDVFDTNIGMLSSKNAIQLKSFDAMFNLIDKLKNDDHREQHINTIHKMVFNVSEKLIDSFNGHRILDLNSSLSACLPFISDIKSAERQLSNNDFDISKIPAEVYPEIVSLAQEIKSLTIHYFEGKPQKTLMFEDFKAVILPNTIDKELSDRIPNNVVKHFYDPNNEEERLAIFNKYSFENPKAKNTLKI